jgi:hypothetical protein
MTMEKATSRTLPHLSGKTLEGTLSPVPRGIEASVSHPMTGPRASHPGSVTTVKAEEPQVKHKVTLLINTGASIPAIPFSPKPRSSKKITVRGVSRQPLEQHFTQPLACSWGDFHFCHSFLIVPVLIHLKDPSWFPHQKQYPLKPEIKEGLIPIIKDLRRQGLLIECASPYNTPILSVRKRPNKWWLVQDLHLINEAVVPLHPVVPNSYMLLAQITPGTTYYSVLDLKNAILCIPLYPKSQPIFAFEDPTRKYRQVTWDSAPTSLGLL